MKVLLLVMFLLCYICFVIDVYELFRYLFWGVSIKVNIYECGYSIKYGFVLFWVDKLKLVF